MKKLFTNPVVEVKSLSAENEVMGVFSVSAEAPKVTKVITDTTTVPTDDKFGYWSSK